MTEERFLSHILYVSGQKNTPGYRTGARTVSDLFINSGLIEQQDGQLKIATSIAQIPDEPGEPAEQTAEPLKDESVADPLKEHGIPAKQIPPLLASPTIAINIQLQLPETEKIEVYEKLFTALRKHLLTPDE